LVDRAAAFGVAPSETMSKMFGVLAATTLAAAVAASPAAAWTTPTTLSSADEANPVAQAAFDGSVLTGWLKPVASLSRRLGPPEPITTADPFEKVWDGGLDADGHAIVVTVRKHKPVQRIRAIIGSSRRTISDNTHSATQPTLDVAPDGTAVAAWAWHDPAGWRAQVAIRRPGQPRFDKPQTVSPPAPGRLRPFVRVAAGEGGRAVLTWQLAGAPLHVLTAGADSTFGADQVLAGGGRWADVSLAVGAGGAVQVAYLGFGGATALRVASGTAGAPLGEPVVLSTGGRGTSSGPQVASAFSADGTATVAWGKPGGSYEEGGTLEVFTRAPGEAFGPAQTLAQDAHGIVLAGGPGGSAALAWMTSQERPDHLHWTVHASTRAQAGGAFGADQPISDPAKASLWPTIAITPKGEAIAAWVTNDSGAGSGQPAASIGSL
jgi:hypothetical protein